MPYSLRLFGGQTEFPVSTTRFFPCACGDNLPNATEVNVSVLETQSGTLFNLMIYINENNTSGSSTIRLRKNAANANMTISVGAGLTGKFRDFTNTDTYTNGDLTAISTVVGAGGGMYYTGSVAVYSQNAIWQKCHSGSPHAAPSIQTQYEVFYGGVQSLTEASVSTQFNQKCVIRNLSMYASSNTVTATSTLNSRKNSGAGNMTMSIPASTGGRFSDTVNYDVVLGGDTWNTQLVAGASGTTLTYNHQIDVVNFPETNMIVSNSDATIFNFGEVASWILCGDGYGVDFEVFGSQYANAHFNLYNGQVKVFTNSLNGDSTVNIRKGTVDRWTNGNCTMSIPAATTGWFSYTGVGDIVVYDEDVHTDVTAGGSSGTIRLTNITHSLDLFSVGKVVSSFPGNLIQPFGTPNNISSTSGSAQ